ncbi:MAG TPA: thiolase family protein [Candidatus Sulfotelmatobacter sp.]|nr:thiolase family protein [Candidatus Sulfotelmatobacter sp.]
MREAVIVEALRTPIGRRGGNLAAWHPVDLLAFVLQRVVYQAGVDPARIDDVIAGCVSQVGEQSVNVARNAVLAAGFPDSVPGTTIDRQCGSSQQAVHFAAQGVMSGTYDLAIACGVEVMSRVPLGSSTEGPGHPYGPGIARRYEGGLVHQGISAELVAQRWGFSRGELDAYSLESHRRAARAQDEGRFAREIVPVPLEDGRTLAADEGIRRDTDLAKLGALRAAFRPDGGVVTAGNASQISDGAAAILIAGADTAAALGLPVRARLRAFAVCGDDPIAMLTATIPATRQILGRTGLHVEDVDLFEVSEAFASPVLAWQRELSIPLERTNVNGGAIALGHPVGASGARLMTTLLHELERTGGRFGLQTMCEGGGMANATLLERAA